MNLNSEHLDETLKILYATKEWYLSLHDIHEQLQLKYPDLMIREALELCNELLFNRYITLEKEENIPDDLLARVTTRDLYYISYKGRELVNNGGYDRENIRIEARKVIENEKEKLTIKQIVSTISSAKTQKATLYITLFTALAALAVSIMGLYKEKATIISPALLLKDTLIESKYKDTIQLHLQLNQSGHSVK